MSKNADILRTIIGILLGLLLIFMALKLKDRIVANKKKPQLKEQKFQKKVFAQKVINEAHPIKITEKGNLQAFRQVDLFAEVQGLLEGGNKLFKPGQYYRKNEVIFSINDDEFERSLMAEKSVLYNQLAQVLPDLKLDYSEVYDKWAYYLNSIDVEAPIPDLPPFENEREKFFINSKNIVTTYYNIKNLEERLKKFKIYAPFNCVVSEALVYPGTLISPGQNLGTILNDDIYELSVSVDASYQEYIRVGKTIELRNLDQSQSWKGRISRIDATVNTLTQGITVYIETRGKGLRPGMFLEASIDAGEIKRSFELSRKLLVDNNYTYSIKNDTLRLVPVEIAFYKDKTAVITNLPDSMLVLKNPIPQAYDGMLVEILNM
jgi:multidrug efflux pump subunit AcrA (membrane-fusion protein)